MRRTSLTLALLALVLWIGASHAGSSLSPNRLARIAKISVIVPPEWDGIWATQDSIYDCEGNLEVALPGADTLCGGQNYTPGDFTCTGTATVTTVDMTCEGTQDAGPDCIADVLQEIHGTRTGDTYFLVSNITLTYSGTGCFGAPPDCFQVNVHGTRSGPTMPADCAPTPARRSTWGEVKTTYR